MGINVSTSMGYEHQDVLKNTAREVLSKNAAHKNSNLKNSVILPYLQATDNTQLAILKASNQISSNSTLNETLKYLKSHAYKKVVKKPVLGELWETFISSNDSEENYNGVLCDFVIDSNLKNIFAA